MLKLVLAMTFAVAVFVGESLNWVAHAVYAEVAQAQTQALAEQREISLDSAPDAAPVATPVPLVPPSRCLDAGCVLVRPR